MMFAVIGLDANGYSHVARVDELKIPNAEKELTAETLWTTDGLPPTLDIPRRAPSDKVAVFTPTPTGCSFIRAIFSPSYESPKHRSDTLDCGVIIEGSARLVLELGEIELGRGDCYLIPGLMHQWIAGADGTTLAVSMLGLGLP
jgi:quercetin dioxygenase-like cupin family protein